MTGPETVRWVRTYERGPDYSESIDGIEWPDAPLPPRWHRCQAQTRGWFTSYGYTERCACGAIRGSIHDPWGEKNQTRRQRAQQRRDAKAPRETITCQVCGQPYEAIAGSCKACERLCTSCWADLLVRSAQ
jgi:hypothetical protein